MSVSNIEPAAIAPGQTVEFKLSGANLTAPLTVWTSFPSAVESVTAAKDGKSAVAKIRTEPGVTPQLGGIMVGGKSGVSAPVAVMVDDMPRQAEAANNHSVETAQQLAAPASVDARSDGAKFDYFRFAAKKGQRISVEVYAHRLGSTFDPVMRVMTMGGEEVGAADDTPGLGGDCCLSAVMPADGDYCIEVHDNQYRSGARYRLRLGDCPVDVMPLPMGVRRGATTLVSLGKETRVLTAPRFGARLPLAWKNPGGTGSALFECIASDLPEHREREPNDDLASGSTAVLPCGWSGVLEKPGDRDWLRFVAKKGRPVYIEASSARVGSPSFAMLRVVDAAGKTLASSKVGASPELSVQFTPAADGEYGLEVRDLLFRGGARSTYRVELRDGPDFRLQVKSDKAAVTRFAAMQDRGAAALTIQCVRRGYDGPVELSLVDAPPGFRLLSKVIPAKASEVRLVVVPAEGSAGQVHFLRLQGSAKIEGGNVQRQVSTAAVLRAKQPAFPFPQAWRDGLIGIAINDPGTPFYTLTAPEQVKCTAAAPLQAALELKRDAKDFKAQVRVFVENQEPSLAVSVKQEKGKYTLNVKPSEQTPIGTHAVTLRSVGEHKGQIHVQTLNLRVDVSAPAKTAAAK